MSAIAGSIASPAMPSSSSPRITGSSSRPSRPISAARSGSIHRSRSTIRPFRSSRATSSCWQPTALRIRRPSFRHGHARNVYRRSRRCGKSYRRGGLSARQRRQHHRADPAHRRGAASRPPKFSAARPNCRCRPCWSRAHCSTAIASSGKCMPLAAATSTSPSTPRPRKWSR